MLHPHTRLQWIDNEVGYGVFATQALPRGTISWVRDPLDREFSPAELNSLPLAQRELIEHFSYRLSSGQLLFCWDHTRFMNHSFHPNCLPTPLGIEVVIRDIAPGQELTNDYGAFNIIEPFTPRPETHTHRQDVLPDDLTRLAPTWDPLISSALKISPSLDQALLPWLPPSVLHQLSQFQAGILTLPSLSTLALLPS